MILEPNKRFRSQINLTQPRESHGPQLGNLRPGLQRRGERTIESIFAVELDVDVLLLSRLLSRWDRHQVAVLFDGLPAAFRGVAWARFHAGKRHRAIGAK